MQKDIHLIDKIAHKELRRPSISLHFSSFQKGPGRRIYFSPRNGGQFGGEMEIDDNYKQRNGEKRGEIKGEIDFSEKSREMGRNQEKSISPR